MRTELLKASTGLSDGRKVEKEKEFQFPETVDEILETFGEEKAVSYFNDKLRRVYMDEIRDELKQENGEVSLSAKDKAVIDALSPTLVALGVDTSDFRTVQEYQEALQSAIAG